MAFTLPLSLAEEVAEEAAERVAREASEEVPEKLYHYTWVDTETAKQIVNEKGLDVSRYSGKHTTPTGDLSPLQAQIAFALPPNRGLPNRLKASELIR